MRLACLDLQHLAPSLGSRSGQGRAAIPTAAIDPIRTSDNLLGGMVEAQVGKPTPMRQGFPTPAAVNPLMTKQESLQLLPGLGQGAGGCGARPH
jgi:hypothetical protein